MERFLVTGLCILVITGLLGCAASKPPAELQAAEVLIPQALPEIGWALEDSLSYYDRDNLFEYINGAAELFLSYGFQKLVTGTYIQQGNSDEFVVADVYDMGTKLNAFGIYAAHQSMDSPTLAIGVEGFIDQFLLAFYKGPYFVHLTLNTLQRPQVEHIAHAIVQRIPGDILPPMELVYLPLEHQIKGTLSYVAQGLLGYGFLPRGIQAEYQWDEEKVTGFVAFFDADEIAYEALEQYRAYVTEAGGEVSRDTALDGPGFFAEEPYHGRLLLIQRRNFLVGVRDLEGIAGAYPLIQDILIRLPNQ